VAERARKRAPSGLARGAQGPEPDLGLEPSSPQGTHQGLVRHRPGLLPGKPSDRWALTGWWRGVHVRPHQQVSQVQVGVAAGGAMHVHVDQTWSAGGMGEREAGFLLRLAQRGIPGPLPGVDVPSGLQPPVEALVHVEHGPTGAHDDRRTGDVLRTCHFVERVLESAEGTDDMGVG